MTTGCGQQADTLDYETWVLRHRISVTSDAMDIVIWKNRLDWAASIRGRDMVIRHARNGQLEAVTADSAGRFEMEFHVLGYRMEDRFEVLVGSLDAPVSFRLRAERDRLNEIPAG